MDGTPVEGRKVATAEMLVRRSGPESRGSVSVGVEAACGAQDGRATQCAQSRRIWPDRAFWGRGENQGGSGSVFRPDNAPGILSLAGGAEGRVAAKRNR